ncbi:MAG TPA: ABC transporter permease [Pyrinomonadaceae bacterium]|nr:ABC transporter permease [Pyrinomonadaceae bacterium]
MNLKTSDTTGRSLAPAPAPPTLQSAAARTDEQGEARGPRVLIRSEESGVQLNLGDLWAYRELLYFLTWRDIKVRYKQTLMGAAWVVLQPLATMLIATLVFNKFARLDSGSLPYPLFAYAGLLLWTFFSNGVTSGTYSLVSNSNLVTKVYFPRAFIPAAAVGAGLVDLGIASLLLVALAAYYGVAPTPSLALAPAFVALAGLLALGTGMLVSALTVKYRDLRHALPFTMQFWMLASPVIYPVEIVPADWRWLLYVNPLVGILEGFRAALAGAPVPWPHVAVSLIVSVVVLLLAYYVFRRLEDTFADVI